MTQPPHSPLADAQAQPPVRPPAPALPPSVIGGSVAPFQPALATPYEPPQQPPPEVPRKKGFIEANFSVVLAVLLGIASMVTAWASYQASLYDGQMAQKNAYAGILAAEAESMYLQANATFVTDAATFGRITELSVQAQYGDSYTADIANQTLDILLFQAVSDNLLAAIDWSNAQNELNPDSYVTPQQSEDYLATLFADYHATKTQASQAYYDALTFNELSDQLTLATVMLAISLFLYGIAAVVKSFRLGFVLAAIATVFTVIATIISMVVVAQPAP